MMQLLFLIILFIAAVAVSFYFSAEGFATDASGNTVEVASSSPATQGTSGQRAASNTLVDSSGNQVPTPGPGVTVDASGNVISSRLKDLISILTQPSLSLGAAPPSRIRSAPASATDDSGNSIVPDASGSLDSFYKTIKPQLQEDIAQAVHKEFERSTVLPKQERNQQLTPAVAQGMAWPPPQPQPQPQPDMSEYIRKDSIPCWACDVKY